MKAPIANLRSKHAQKQKPKGPSLRERAMQALDADFKLHGEDAIKQMRETKVDRYVELATRPADVATDEFANCNSHQDIGRKLLQSIGFSEPDDVSIQAAIELNNNFVDGLQAIYQRAQASEEEIH